MDQTAEVPLTIDMAHSQDKKTWQIQVHSSEPIQTEEMFILALQSMIYDWKRDNKALLDSMMQEH